MALAAGRDGRQAVSGVLVCREASVKSSIGDATRVLATGKTSATGATGARRLPGDQCCTPLYRTRFPGQ